MTILLRIHRDHTILSAKEAAALEDCLRTAVHLLVKNQRPDGAWMGGWYLEFGDDSAARAFQQSYPTHSGGLAHATGHLLEWVFLLPPDLAPPPAVVEKSLDWCLGALRTATAEELHEEFCPYSHCFRSLRKVIEAHQNHGIRGAEKK